jgi:hypothetical protein
MAVLAGNDVTPARGSLQEQQSGTLRMREQNGSECAVAGLSDVQGPLLTSAEKRTPSGTRPTLTVLLSPTMGWRQRLG